MSKSPWCETNSESGTAQTTFEDNFTSASTEKLPDSDEYLKSLETKLNKLRTDTSVLKQLADRREECMEKLLAGTIELPADPDLDFADRSNQSVTQFVRHIIPEQALNIAELVHIIEHDQLAATEPVEDVVDQSKQNGADN